MNPRSSLRLERWSGFTTIARSGGWKTKLAIWIGALCFSLSALSYAGISLFTADRLTRSTNHPSPIDPRQLGIRRTAVVDTNIRRRSRSAGWYLPTQERRHLIVLVHGMWSSWLEMAALGRDLHRSGFDVLLFDLRGHGQSDPSRLYLGRRERADIRAVMAWADSRGFHAMTGSAGSAIRWAARRCSWRPPAIRRSRWRCSTAPTATCRSF